MTKKGRKMTKKNEKVELIENFDQKVDKVLDYMKASDKLRDIVHTWYDIEGEDEDISTERLISMVSDITEVEYEDVVETMCNFSNFYDICEKEGVF